MVVYPVDGRRVRCPVSKRPVPDEGLTVGDHDQFWARRLRDEDVTLDAPRARHLDADAPPPAGQDATEEHDA